jgi:hypothetical protein
MRTAPVAAVQQRQHGGLVRDGQPQAVDVVGPQHLLHEATEVVRAHLPRHQHRIYALRAEDRVEERGRLHLGDRVAEDHEDAGAAGDVHGRHDRPARVAPPSKSGRSAR